MAFPLGNEVNSAVFRADGSIVSYEKAINELVERAKNELIIISPYLSFDVLANHDRLDKSDAPAVRVVVCPGDSERSAKYIFTSQLDPEILLTYKERGFEIKKNCRVHTKMIISDGRIAIVGSANLSFAALKPERWETGIWLEKGYLDKWALYDYASRLVNESRHIRTREIRRWIEIRDENRKLMEAANKTQEDLDRKVLKKTEQERRRARGKGEALMIFADEDQIDNALKQRRIGFVGLMKSASTHYKFPDCDWHLDLLLDEMRYVPVWLYARNRKEVLAKGRITYSSYNQIDTLLRSYSHQGYVGISDNTWPVDSGVPDIANLDHRKLHVLVVVEALKKLRTPISIDQLHRKGLKNPNVGPGGRYVPISIYKSLS